MSTNLIKSRRWRLVGHIDIMSLYTGKDEKNEDSS
jgi:hypothetical protein